MVLAYFDMPPHTISLGYLSFFNLFHAMKAFLQFCLFIALGCGFVSLKAQNPSQVIIANGGQFSSTNYVTIACWNLSTGNYVVFDSFPASSVQHVNIYSRDAYVCADSFVVRYNLDNLTREAIAVVPGARESKVWRNKVVVSKGFGAIGEHVVVLNASDLSLSSDVTGITGNCEGISIIGNTAYVANPNSFAAITGSMAIVDLNSESLSNIVALDTLGKQIQDLYKYQNKIYSVNIIKFNNPTYGVITEFTPSNSTFVHHKIDLPLSNSAGIINGKLYLNIDGAIGSIDMSTVTVSDTALIPGFWAGMATDTVNDRLYLTETDYFSYGKLYSYDLQGNRLDSLNVGISPEALAVDYNISVSSTNPKSDIAKIVAFPQPFNSKLNLDLEAFSNKATEISMTDILGRVVFQERVKGGRFIEINTENIGQGTYILKVVAGSNAASMKVVKIEK